MAEFLFLGTGASLGVPMIGCSCATCLSTSLFNKRMRPSALVKLGQKKFLLDAGPDFRSQALQHGINELDGILLTHAHQDHVAGLDDLRPLLFKRTEPLPILLSRQTAKDIEHRFHYLFKKNHFAFHYLPEENEGSVIFERCPIQFMTYEQAHMPVNGFRLGELAYLSDIRDYPETIFNHLQGVNTLIISALRFTTSKLHFSVDEAIDFARKIDVPQVFLTHLSHDLEHEKTNAYLPSFVKLSFDGLIINFNY